MKFGLVDALEDFLETKLSLTQPTDIQRQTIPALLANDKDVVISSQTGSGKTFAFILPLIQLILTSSAVQRNRGEQGTLALIVAPTRELVLQISSVLFQLTAYSQLCHWFVSTALIGGESRKSEKARLRKGVHIVIGTPGRLLDHLEATASWKLDCCSWVILDEGDRLLDLGFEKQMKKIFTILKDRCTNPILKTRRILCSATITSSLDNLIAEHLDEPIYIQANDANAAPSSLSQQYIITTMKDRLSSLFNLLISLSRKKSGKMILFVSCCDSVDFHYRLLVDIFAKKPQLFHSLQIFSLHGSKNQTDRQAALKSFSSASFALLVCTDVAARGLDFPDVEIILQYDAPADINDYVHRAGRTARMQRQGFAFLFLLESERDYLRHLQVKGLKLSEKKIELATYFGDLLASLIASSQKLKSLAIQAYHSWIRAYATHPASEKAIFHIKKLHLGHVAQAFALADAPSKLEAIEREKKQIEVVKKRLNNSEFGSGLQIGKKGTKKKIKLNPI